MRRCLRLAVALVASVSLTDVAHAQAPRAIVDVTLAQARASMMVDPRLTREKARIAMRQADGIADLATRSTSRATALWLEGEASSRLSDYAAAAPKLDEALALVRRFAPGSQLEGDVLISRAGAHGTTGHVVAALREYQRAHSIFQRIGNARQRAIALICIASLYNDAKDYGTALKYFDQALAVYDGDPQLTVSIQNNRSLVLRSIGRYPEAVRGFRAALSIAETLGSPIIQAQTSRNIAKTQLRMGDLRGASITIAKAENIAGGADAFNQQAILAVAAQAAFQSGRTREALSLIERSFAGVDLTTTAFGFRDAHDTAYQVYHALGRNAEAAAHLLAVKRLDDQTTRLATSTGAALMAARFDFANQELRIARLKADDMGRRAEAAREQSEMQRKLFMAGAGATMVVILALLVGLVVARRSRDQVRAANADLGLANTELGKALAAKTEFLATTSHEIRTPLNGILGMTQVMLADPGLPPATRERIGVVQAAGTTMRALVDDILDVAKMENGKLTLESAPFDLHATVLDATRLWDVQAEAKGISFTRMLDDCPRIVAGDASRVRQVVFNLLSNALKFTPSGEVAITAHRRPDGQVAVAVRDSGIGIPADKLEAIFESFRQADAGTTRQFGGTGLGLAICRQLARAMGGDVVVESRIGEGSVFTVTLPLAAVAPVAAQADGEAGAPALLVIERNPIARSLFRTLLEPHAGRVIFAGDVASGLAALEAGAVSRILADEATLAVDGVSLTALDVLVEGVAGRATVIALWSAHDEVMRDALMATGVDRVVAKPVSGPDLVASLFRQGNDPLVRRAA